MADKRPKDMTADERDALPVRDPTTIHPFAIEDDDILAFQDMETGATWGFAQDRDKSWFRYRVEGPRS